MARPDPPHLGVNAADRRRLVVPGDVPKPRRSLERAPAQQFETHTVARTVRKGDRASRRTPVEASLTPTAERRRST